MRAYCKKMFAGLMLALGLMLFSVCAQATDTDWQNTDKVVMRITARSGNSEVQIPVYAQESYWYGYNFWVEAGYDLLLASQTATVSVYVEVLDPSIILADSLQYQKSLKMEKTSTGYMSNIESAVNFQYRSGDHTENGTLTYAINAHVLKLSVDNLYLTVGKTGFRPSKNNYLPIQVNLSVEAFNSLDSYYSQSGKCYLRLRVLNKKNKYVFTKSYEVSGSGYLRFHWDGKAVKKNTAKVKAGSYVPNGTYKVEAYLYYQKASGQSYMDAVKPAKATKSFKVSSKAPKGEDGLAKGTELPIYTGYSEVDYMAEQMLKEAGVKTKDSADTKVRKIYHYMTVYFKHVHSGEKTPKAHFNLTKAKTKNAVKKFAAAAQKKYKNKKILYSYGVSPYYGRMGLENHMDTRSGVCDNHAEIFAVLCQHAGINAGVCQGYYLNLNGTKAGHAWNYAVVNGRTWYYDVDVEIQNYRKGQGDYYWYKKTKSQAVKNHKFVNTY